MRYSRVNITENAIPLWGMCHKRRDNNVILMTGSEEASCYRCFHLKLVSKNVLRVLAADKDYLSKCHTNEEKALASCLSDDDLLNEAKNTEIILYSKSTTARLQLSLLRSLEQDVNPFPSFSRCSRYRIPRVGRCRGTPGVLPHPRPVSHDVQRR